MKDRLDWSEWTDDVEGRRLKIEIDAACAMIEKVHIAPDVPLIVIHSITGVSRIGGYVPEREIDEQGYPVIRHIDISVEGRSPRLTFAHEWGHCVSRTARMATMTQEQMIRSKICEILGRHPWHDLCPLEQAVEGAMAFRSTLSGASLKLFDDLMLEGVLPENAAQSVQFAIDHDLLTEQPEVVQVAKAS